jgi:hypothetical protein
VKAAYSAGSLAACPRGARQKDLKMFQDNAEWKFLAGLCVTTGLISIIFLPAIFCPKDGDFWMGQFANWLRAVIILRAPRNFVSPVMFNLKGEECHKTRIARQ